MDVEDGEILESDEELPKDISDNLDVYTCIERPVAPRPPVPPPPVASDGDDSPAADSDSDSDSDCGAKRRRPAPSAPAPPAAAAEPGHNAAFAEASWRLQAAQARQARLAVWSTVLAEDGITADLAGGLGQMRAGPRVERDVESYQLPEPRPERPPPAAAGPESARKRGFQQASAGWRRKKTEAVKLEPLVVTEESPAQQVAADIALKLREEKPEIIANIVKIVGVKKAIELFEETKSVEEGGGMLVNNWSRRRTPGGVYIQLLKTDPEVTEEQVRDVFRDERRLHDRERKVARRRRQRARLAQLREAAEAAGGAGRDRESGEASSDSADSEESDADSEAAQSAGSRAERTEGELAEAASPPEPAEHDMSDAELEVSNEIIFE